MARWAWLRYPVALFLVTRLALFLLVHLSLFLAPTLFRVDPMRPLPEIPVLDGLCRFDCNWFAAIADDGYLTPRQTNFFPLFPAIAGLLGRVAGIHTDAALVLFGNLAGLAALIVVYRLFLHLSDEPAARAGLALFAAYPFAFFQAAGYPESLMILSTALAVLLALQGRHILAGAVLGIGVLARHLTLLGGASLLIAQARQRPSVRRFVLDPGILGLALPWLALAGYCLYQYLTFGDPLTWYRARDEWGPIAWWGLDDLLANTAAPQPLTDVLYTYIPFALVVTVATVALLRTRRWAEIAGFGLVLLAVLWSVGVFGLGRYSASCWPAFLALGTWLAPRPHLLLPALVGSGVLQGLYAYLFVHGFPVL